MLRLECQNEVITLQADGFQLSIDPDGLVASLIAHPRRLGKANGADAEADARGLEAVVSLSPDPLVAEFFLPASCNADGRPDYSYDIASPTVRKVGDGLLVEMACSSSIWERKKYVFHCAEDRLEYYYLVHGAGNVDSCEFFQGFVGNASAAGVDKPWVNAGFARGLFGRMRSKAHFLHLFNPEPNGLRKQHFSPNEFTTIGVRNNKSYCRGNWFFTPGPFCYVMKTITGKCFTLALAVKPGQHNFVEYEYQGGNGFGLSLRYEGKARVDQTWESPHVVIFSADDEYSAIRRYCDYLRESGYVPDNRTLAFDWWREPIFCGWGEQSYLSYVEGRKTASYATQANYESFVRRLEQNGLNPGTIIVDDKWQASHGDPYPDLDKWPDMAGFIAQQHAAGRRVVLWLKAWDPEGVPPEECLLDSHRQPVAVDPTDPAYEKRLRRCIRTLIAELGADGFKIDFTADLPCGCVSQKDAGIWGVELLRRLIWVIYSEAKKAREDALIIAHTVNPYFADVVDMVRLNDIAILPGEESYAESMVHRQKVAKATSSTWLVDTDNWPSPTLASWLEYARLQPKLGVPSLYYVTHIDESGEEIGKAHIKEIADILADYRRGAGES